MLAAATKQVHSAEKGEPEWTQNRHTEKKIGRQLWLLWDCCEGWDGGCGAGTSTILKVSGIEIGLQQKAREKQKRKEYLRISLLPKRPESRRETERPMLDDVEGESGGDEEEEIERKKRRDVEKKRWMYSNVRLGNE
jgi:hypothetical protein